MNGSRKRTEWRGVGNRPLISVITVVLNDMAGFVATANSVIRQSGVDYEYAVKDGGSSDGTWDLVRRFGSFIDIAETGNDGGIYGAMNQAVRMASGKWIAFLNAGDVYTDGALGRLAEHARKGGDVIYSDVKSAESGKLHPYHSADEYWKGMTFDHQSCLVRRRLLLQNPFDEGLRIAGDLDFFSRLHASGRRFAKVESVTAIKPFSRGASVGYAQRFPERFEVLMRNFSKTHPVEAALTDELSQHAQARGLKIDEDESVESILERLRKVEQDASAGT